MKKLTLLFTAIFVVLSLNAQDDVLKTRKLSNEEFFEKAELVIEGRVIKTFDAYDAKGNYDPNDIYTIQAIRVQRVYKGDQKLTNDTMYVVRQWGTILKEVEWEEGRVLLPVKSYPPKNDSGISLDYYYDDILFFVKSDFPDNPAKTAYSHKPKYRFLQDKAASVLRIRGKISGLNNLIFNNREELYQYMKQFKEYIVPVQPVILPAQPVKEYKDPTIDSTLNEMIQKKWGDGKKKVLNKSIKANSTTTLSLQFANQQIVYNNTLQKYYLEFDVLASQNNPNLYFDAIKLKVGYDTAVFGSNIMSNGKLSITKGSRFNNADDYTFYALYDQYSNGIQFNFSVNLIGTPNRVQLDTTPIPLLHFQVELLPTLHTATTQLVFLDTVYTSIFSTYTLTNDADVIMGYIDYDHTFYTNSAPFVISTDTSPVITTDFSGISKIAGIGDTLSIRGYNFGTEKGSVHFTCAEKGGVVNGNIDFLNDLDDQYHVIWSDTLIRVIVPSFVYKRYELFNGREGAGTGPIKIKTAARDSCISATSLYIPVSVANTKQPGDMIRRVYLARKSCDYDFQFTLHSHYQNDAQKVAIIDTALRHWSRLTGLTLILERNPFGNLIFLNTNDAVGRNMIFPFDDTTSNMMVTKTANAIYPGDTVFCRFTQTNIQIKDIPSATTTWNYAISGSSPAGTHSFYHAFMHELGHVLLLEHVIDSTLLMHCSLPPAKPIHSVSSSDIAVQAVNQMIGLSKAINWSAGSGLKKIGVPAKPTITSPSGKTLICNSSPITLTTNNPTGNLWSNGATTQSIQATTAGNYTVTHTDEGCLSVSNPFTLTSSNLSAWLGRSDLICPNDNTGTLTAVNVTGNHPPFIYYWTGPNTNIISTTQFYLENLAAGQYNLSLTDIVGCNVNYSATILSPSPFVLQLLATSSISNGMINVSVSGGTSPYTYQWSRLSTTPGRCGAIPANYANASSIPATYMNAICSLKCTITDYCGRIIVLTNFPSSKSLKSEEEATDITLYPNPSSGKFRIRNYDSQEIERVEIYDIFGKLQSTFVNLPSDMEIDVSNLAAGVYLVKIIEGNNKANKKLVLYYAD